MTEFLVRIFIKDKDKIDNKKVRERYGILSSIVGIICNLFLFGIKLTIGILIHSISVMADAFNNLSDAASSIISFIGVKVSNRPADKEHPFGHGRSEYLAALIIAFLIIEVGLSCFKSSFQKILHPEKIYFDLFALIILCISVSLKLWLGTFNRKLGTKINSAVMKATAADSFGDVIITSSTIFAIILSKLIGINMDGYMGLIVSVFVMFAGINIARETFEPLLGEAVTPEMHKKITQIVESYEGIVGSHDLIVHNYGPSNIMATIHAEVPNTFDIEEAHETIDCIEREILKEHNIFLVIHMDPVEVKDETVLKYKNIISGIVNQIEKDASIHDFRVVNGNKQINLIFDLVVPYTCDSDNINQIKKQLTEEVNKIDCRLNLMITIENSFIAGED